MQESLLTASHLHFYFHSHLNFRVHFFFKIDEDSRSNAPFKPPCYLHSLCMSLGNACPLLIDHGSANTADHLLLARRFVASGCLQKKACFACLLAWLAWLAWLACFVAAWLLRSAL